MGAPISKIFADISPEPIAAASLGQVYKGQRISSMSGKIIYLLICCLAIFLRTGLITLQSLFAVPSPAAHLPSGELVAVKVQRPGMTLSLTLDALLFNMIGGQLKRFAKARKDLLVAVNEMVSIFMQTSENSF